MEIHAIDTWCSGDIVLTSSLTRFRNSGGFSSSSWMMKKVTCEDNKISYGTLDRSFVVCEGHVKLEEHKMVSKLVTKLKMGRDVESC
jgi:hypothetical protein